MYFAFFSIKVIKYKASYIYLLIHLLSHIIQKVLLDGSNTQIDCTSTDLRETFGEECAHVDANACEACSIQLPEKTFLSLPKEQGYYPLYFKGSSTLNTRLQITQICVFLHLGPNFTPKHGTQCRKALTRAFGEESKRLDRIVKHAIITFPAGMPTTL